MTEKRFTMHQDYGIHDHDKSVIHDIETFSGILDVISELNELYEESQRLKSLLQSERRELIEQNNNYRKLFDELHEENQQCENEIARLQLINNKLKDKDYISHKEKIQELQEENKEFKKKNEQLRQARKFFEEVLFNVIYATSDYQRLVLNKELLEVIDECKSLDELREKANYGIEEFKEEHGWL